MRRNWSVMFQVIILLCCKQLLKSPVYRKGVNQSFMVWVCLFVCLFMNLVCFFAFYCRHLILTTKIKINLFQAQLVE